MNAEQRVTDKGLRLAQIVSEYDTARICSIEHGLMADAHDADRLLSEAVALAREIITESLT